MTRKILIFVASFLILASVTFAQETKSADADAVKQTVEYYFDGWKNNDVASMKKAFNPKAKWFTPTNTGELAEIKINDVFSNIAKNAQQKSPNVRTITRILDVDVTGETASAKVEFEYPDAILGGATSPETQQKIPGVKRTEYLSLIKFKEGWQIVGKVFFAQSISAPIEQSVSLKQ